MGIIRKVFALGGWTTLGATASYALWTRKSHMAEIPPSDYLFHSTIFRRLNPHDSPVTQDVCVRKVPLSKIRPELREEKHEGKLVEAFSAGVWSGWGFAYQRRFLEKKYRSDPVTADHLWDHKDLRSSTYEVGTKITDHFEVVAKSPTSIIIRCGDSPRHQDLRSSDGLFELTAEIDRATETAEFRLKSVFFNGLGSSTSAGPMPAYIQWLHQQYDKVLMETALTNCTN